MFQIVHREPTPNPNAFKFRTGNALVDGGHQLNFASSEGAEKFAPARELFKLDGVTAVMIADDFVSVSASTGSDWDEIEGVLQRELENYSRADATRLAEEQAAAAVESKASREGDDLFQKVDQILTDYVRPALEGDGGGIELVDVADSVVTIRYQGACGSCPTSTANTLAAIENLLKSQVRDDLQVQPA